QPWYAPLGQGMVPTLGATTERQAYTLVDRLTYLERRDTLDLTVLVERDPDLLRLFHAITINPAKGPWIDEVGANALVAYLLSPAARFLIRAYSGDRSGEPIFVPASGRTERELKPASRPAACPRHSPRSRLPSPLPTAHCPLPTAHCPLPT